MFYDLVSSENIAEHNLSSVRALGYAGTVILFVFATRMTTAANAIFNPSAQEKTDLVTFLRSIDPSTAPVPVPTPSAGKAFDICTGY